MLTRRRFLARGLRDSSLVALAPMLPRFLECTARAAAPEQDARVLVVLQLDGGNDGLNTIVPYEDDGYARARKALRLPTEQLITIGDGLGLHQSLRDMAALFEAAQLAIVPGVGYPNPSRSHFRSMAIWHAARLDPREHTGLGWIGRALDDAPRAADGWPAGLLVGPDELPPALRGRRCVSAAIDGLDDYMLAGPPRADGAGMSDDLGQFLERSLLGAYATADRIDAVRQTRDRAARYPDSELARRLRLAAELLKGGLRARVFYVEQSGYDTHGLQLPQHATLLSELAAALRAFFADLAAAKLAERVLVLCFSEFGRRVHENASLGTDHGTAGPVFLAGPAVRPGITGRYPSLTELDDGDLKMTVDFRRVYASVLEGWLGIPSRAVLAGAFEPLPLVRP